MGIILSKVRKKKSAVETLEKLENDIKEIEENRSYAQMRYKKITKLFLVYSLGLYIVLGIFFYFQFTSTLKEKLLYLVPLALSPLLLYLVKRIISWYYIRLINKNQSRLNEMKKEKKRILDEVMDKETYKVAKEILEKFSVDSAPKLNQGMQVANFRKSDEGLKRRIVNVPNVTKPQSSSSMIKSFDVNQSPQLRNANPMSNRALQVSNTLIPRLPAPILPLERSYVDKVVEYLIGDGPNNRYALICSRCHSHNGMALKEEFEYIGFKCCYCFFYNPARKVRPEAPKLESLIKANEELESESDSKTSDENLDDESEAVLDTCKQLEKSCENTSHNFQSPKIENDTNSHKLESIVNNLCDDSIEKENIQLIEPKYEENQAEKTERRNSNEFEDICKPNELKSCDNCDESLLKT